MQINNNLVSDSRGFFCTTWYLCLDVWFCVRQCITVVCRCGYRISRWKRLKNLFPRQTERKSPECEWQVAMHIRLFAKIFANMPGHRHAICRLITAANARRFPLPSCYYPPAQFWFEKNNSLLIKFLSKLATEEKCIVVNI